MDHNTQEILASAATLFDKYGQKKTTMEDIALAVGKGKSTLYYYFKNKDAVYQSVLNSEFESFQKAVGKHLAVLSSKQIQISNFIKGVFLELINYPNLKKVLMDHPDSIHKKWSTQLKDQFGTWELEKIQCLIEEGIDTGEIRSMSKEELVINSQAVSIAMMGLKVILLEEEKPEVIELKIDSLLALLFNGIKSVDYE